MSRIRPQLPRDRPRPRQMTGGRGAKSSSQASRLKLYPCSKSAVTFAPITFDRCTLLLWEELFPTRVLVSQYSNSSFSPRGSPETSSWEPSPSSLRAALLLEGSPLPLVFWFVSAAICDVFSLERSHHPYYLGAAKSFGVSWGRQTRVAAMPSDLLVQISIWDTRGCSSLGRKFVKFLELIPSIQEVEDQKFKGGVG